MIKTAVIPVAGVGTRVLPVAKSVAKELLPVGFKPIIHYIVQECICAGVDHIILVCSPNKQAISDYFTPDSNLSNFLQGQGKEDLAKMMDDICSPTVTIETVMQFQPLGLGHAILCAEQAVGNEPFFVILPDDFIHNPNNRDGGCLQHMVDQYGETQGNIIALQKVAKDKVSSYGVVVLDNNNVITQMIEKPSVSNAPSDFAIVGRYILHPKIFEHLRTIPRGVGNEYQLTDAMVSLLQTQDFYGYLCSDVILDCSTKLGFLEANIRVMLADTTTAQDTQDLINRYSK